MSQEWFWQFFDLNGDPIESYQANLDAYRSPHCPQGFLMSDGMVGGSDQCYRPLPVPSQKNRGCCDGPAAGGPEAGNPINGGIGNKVQKEIDYLGPGPFPLTFSRTYNSIYGPSVSSTQGFWQTNFDRAISQIGGVDTYIAYRPGGKAFIFTLNGNTGLFDPDVSDRVERLVDPGGDITGWEYVASDDSVETYDASGVLQSITDKSGLTQTLTHSDMGTPVDVAPNPGLLIRVTDSFGRALLFTYDPANRLATMTDPNGGVTSFTYSDDTPSELLERTTPDGAVRTYVYNEAAHTGNTDQPNALTGIVDENGARFATYSYDTYGRATGTEHAGGADSYTLSYSGNNTTILDPLDAQRSYLSTTVYGVVKPVSITETCPSCPGGTITHSNAYDANGYPDETTDLDGILTDHDYDSRGLETQRIEAKTIGDGSTPPEKRTIQTDWHPDFRVPVERRTLNASGVLEAKTDWAYNSRGQESARCEIDPADPAAMGYACSATTAPPIGAKVRRTVTAYCEQADVDAGTCPLVGVVKSVNGPRTSGDPGMSGQDDTTTYTYYQTDDIGCSQGGQTAPDAIEPCNHRHGDLWKVTNALGQVTTYVTYDGNGRVTRMQDANGIFTDFAYHPRGWLTDRTVRASANGNPSTGDANTHIDYNPVGTVARVTQPDGSYLGYTYDDAHRLIKITDNLGDTIDYCPGGVGSAECLDAAGNKRVEQVRDPSGAIKRQLHRVYNQLGQLTQVLNAAGQPVETSAGLTGTGIADGYDGNGNRVLVQDGLGTTTRQEYDPLNRLKATIQNYEGIDPATHDATTQFAYDTRDNLRSVTDPDGLTTSYTYDGLNNLIQLASPDTGVTTDTYDAAGNRTVQTDARGVATTYTYDALNRLIGTAYPTASLDVTYAYDQPNATTGCSGSYPLGRLTTMTDASGSTTYCYDRRGNVTSKVQVTGTYSRTTQYAYTLSDRLSSITYPSGAKVTYGRDAVGRVTSLGWAPNRFVPPTPLVTGTSYAPFGPLTGLTFGNGRTLSKAYDQDYAIDSITSSAAGGLTLDLGVDVSGNITSASATLNPTTPDRVYGYDPLYRLTTAATGSGSPLEAYTYTPTGDRLSASLNGGTATPYAYAPATHHLASVGATGRTYDANGNTQTGIGGWTFSYNDNNRLASASKGLTGYTYRVNGRGERVRKTRSGTGISDTVYGYDEAGHLLGEYKSSGATQAEYLYLDDTLVAVNLNGTLDYVETDQLGTPHQLIDPARYVAVWTWDNLASTFGTNTPNPDPDADGTKVAFNPRFPGQYFDAETGLNYNYFRDYEPGTGRYAESDPVGVKGDSSTYAYVGQDPVAGVDQFGLKKIFGNWCGPDWTGGYRKEWNQLSPYEQRNARPPIGPLDQACKKHDQCY